MLDNLPAVVEPEYVYSRVVLISGSLLVAVQDDVVSFADDTFESSFCSLDNHPACVQSTQEQSVLPGTPVGRLGYMQSLAFRACRLVVNTGLHAKRWTREEANIWFIRKNGSNPEEVRGEVDRYCAWPCQACGYKVGRKTINQLRERAKGALGEKFDYRQFNDAIVLGGAVPMTVLGRVVDDYIAKVNET